jgi:predicted HAD superfamily Cof-like phosphohydrolase
MNINHDNREARVEALHAAFGLAINESATPELLALRKTLIAEETAELFADMDTAIGLLSRDETVPAALWANMLKELADIQFVVSGMAVSLQPMRRLEEAFDRVWQSNMSKLGPDGKPVLREDGKFLKGPNYKAADLSDLV